MRSEPRIKTVRTRISCEHTCTNAQTPSKLRALITRSKQNVSEALEALERARRARNLTEQEESAVRVMTLKAEFKEENKGDCKLLCLYDSGSDAHVTNDRSVFDESTLRACSVDVYGISEDNSVRA